MNTVAETSLAVIARQPESKFKMSQKTCKFKDSFSSGWLSGHSMPVCLWKVALLTAICLIWAPHELFHEFPEVSLPEWYS